MCTSPIRDRSSVSHVRSWSGNLVYLYRFPSIRKDLPALLFDDRQRMKKKGLFTLPRRFLKCVHYIFCRWVFFLHLVAGESTSIIIRPHADICNLPNRKKLKDTKGVGVFSAVFQNETHSLVQRQRQLKL